MAAEKCEVVPAAGSASSVLQTSFPGWQWKSTGGIKLLGAPLGDAEYCASVLTERAAKAQELVDAIGKYGHTQGALLQLRHCASWGKLVYAARTVPPALHGVAFAQYGSALRKGLEQLVGDVLPDRCWELAQLCIGRGGLGIRDPGRHAPAAYLASLAQTRSLCGVIDRCFDAQDTAGGSLKEVTSAAFRAGVLDAAAWDSGTELIASQKELSGLLDAAACERLLATERHDAAFVAHVALCQIPGAGVWLTANPVEDGREIEASLFQVALKRRLRVPVFAADGFCPCCGQLSDKWGDHTLVCACAGDRTIRHNAVRDVVFEEAVGGGLRPEREKAGLLPERPVTDGFRADAKTSTGGRRPADIWLPRGTTGGKEALDFAVTSAMRGDLFRHAAEDPGKVFEQYNRYKREYKNTAEICKEAGFCFMPMVIEAHGGGWSPTARRVLAWLARQGAAANLEAPAAVSLRIAQRTSCILQRENARAILRRTAAEALAPAQPSGWDTAPFEWR